MPRKVAFASRWGQTCGISTYTEQLAAAVKRAGFEVVVFGPALCDERGEQAIREVPGFEVEYAWRRGSMGMRFNTELLPKLVEKHQADVLHVQHEFGIWDDDEGFLGMMQALRATPAKLYVTVHTVWPYGNIEHRQGFFERLGRVCDGVITHTPAAHASVAIAMRRTCCHALKIPHGTPQEQKGDAARGAELLGVARDHNIVLSQGFLGGGKNLVNTVFTFAEALSRGWLPPKTKMVFAGAVNDGIFLQKLEGAIAATGYAPFYQLYTEFISPQDMPHVMAAASCAVLNTTAWTLSASGAAHAHAAHHVPLAVADRPIYTEAVQAGALPFHLNDKEPWKPTPSGVTALAALVNSPEVQDSVRRHMAAWAMRTAWDRVVANRYRRLYGGNDAD